jgi:glucose/arabinose dehydrogenase
MPPGAMALAPNGDVFVSSPKDGRILVLPDRNMDGLADMPDGAAAVFVEGLNRPYGLGFIEGWLYVAATDAILRYPYRDGDLVAAGPAERISDLPSEGDHWARPLAFDREGHLYVGVGASCNVCEESDTRRAAVLQMQADGSAAKLYSAGLRSPLGFAFHPETGDVWTGDRGREGLGDEKPPDEINRLTPGGHFGWPHCWGQQIFDPQLRGERDFCGATVAPMVELDAQSGVGGMLFYTGRQFPESYRGDLYIAMNGSATRRGLPTGYSVVRVPFNGWAPRGEVFAFAEGWLRPDTRRWGSPVDLVMARDGALLVSDDGGGLIYRIFYAGEAEEGEAESP